MPYRGSRRAGPILTGSIRANAERFSEERFARLGEFVRSAWAAFQSDSRGPTLPEEALVPTRRNVTG